MNPILFISGSEIIIVLIAVLLFFGAKKIPELARGLGKGLKEFRNATEDIKKEINQSSSDIVKDVKDIRDNVKDSLK